MKAVGSETNFRFACKAAALAALCTLFVFCLCSCSPDPAADFDVAGGKANMLVQDDGGDQPFVFAFYADPQGNPEIHQRICRRINLLGCDFAVMGGDCVFDGSSTSE